MYAADALLKEVPGSRVDVFDRVPTPFGLIRFGVAPDHFKTKNTARQFARTFELDEVRYLGNVEIGRDLSIDELKNNYDAVVLAIGSYNDRTLGIPGEDLPGVYGACAFVGWYNGHPDYRNLEPLLNGGGVAVIGIGNVALDVCRVLGKTRAEMQGSDIAAHALDAIQAAPLDNLHMFGRRGPVEGGFTPKELGEVREMERCAVIVDEVQLPATVEGDFEGREKGVKEKNLTLLRELAGQDKPEKPIKMHIGFYASPVEILGETHPSGGRARQGHRRDVRCALRCGGDRHRLSGAGAGRRSHGRHHNRQ
jgi:ferredoxin--NADP+ reductase